MSNTFASPTDTAQHGEYSILRDPGDARPLYRFEGRISTDGSTPFAAEAGRDHIHSSNQYRTIGIDRATKFGALRAWNAPSHHDDLARAAAR